MPGLGLRWLTGAGILLAGVACVWLAAISQGREEGQPPGKRPPKTTARRRPPGGSERCGVTPRESTLPPGSRARPGGNRQERKGVRSRSPLRAARRKEVVVFVRIIATPTGEPPEEVRRAWIGLELPLAAGETGP